MGKAKILNRNLKDEEMGLEEQFSQALEDLKNGDYIVIE